MQVNPIYYWKLVGLHIRKRKRGKRGGKKKSGNNMRKMTNSYNFPRIYYTNVCSLNTEKIDLLQVICDKYEILAISETWGSLIKNFTFPGFNVFECNRINKSGGGSAIFVKDGTPVVQYRNYMHNNSKQFEITWIITRPSYLPKEVTVIAIACIYFPPNSDKTAHFNLYEAIISGYDNISVKYTSPAFLIMGDFNRWKYADRIKKHVAYRNLLNFLHL